MMLNLKTGEKRTLFKISAFLYVLSVTLFLVFASFNVVDHIFAYIAVVVFLIVSGFLAYWPVSREYVNRYKWIPLVIRGYLLALILFLFLIEGDMYFLSICMILMGIDIVKFLINYKKS